MNEKEAKKIKMLALKNQLKVSVTLD